MSDQALVHDLEGLRDALSAVRLPLPLASTAGAIATRDEAVAQIEDYLLPRLVDIDAPLLAVLGGSTGSGKSTLTNTLVGSEVSQAGVLRPTTRAPVLVHHPDDAAWFAGDGVLPELPRSTGERGTGYALHLVATEGIPAGLGLLDSPDIDSVEVANHELAAQLLGAADLWLFVTTAARYADAVPWQYLARASERSAAVALIVNRIPPDPDGANVAAITGDVRRMLDHNGLADARLFAIEEGVLVGGRLTGGEAPVQAWITDLVADSEARAETIRRTVQGALDSLQPRVARVMVSMREHRAAAEALESVSHSHERRSVVTVSEQLASGILLRGEVLDRFREQVGTAEWMDRLQRGVGRIRDRIASLITGEAPQVEAAKGQLRSNLVGLIDDAVTTGLEETVAAWRTLPGGPVALSGLPIDGLSATPIDGLSPSLREGRETRQTSGRDGRPSDGLSPSLHENQETRQTSGRVGVAIDDVERAVEAWQDHVVATVRQQAGSKIAVARGVSLGVNGVGVTVMMALFASTGGLTGGEVAVAGGTAAFSQALLSAIFGEQAIRDLASGARTDLLDRVALLAATAHDQLRAGLAQLPSDAQIDALDRAVDAVSR